jgi:GH43 family beta-xylosidase
MKNFRSGLVMLGVCAALGVARAEAQLLKTADIRIRDPYIYADAQSKTYYLYAQAANRKGSGFTGVEAYAGKDLAQWQPPKRVLVLPDDAGIQFVWAPEMHRYKGRYYLFVTLTYNRALPGVKPVEDAKWPGLQVRGTHVFHADNPLGPFTPFKSSAHTPADWMALDGTFFEEKGQPFMVFCHEWVQLVDGTMDCLPLKDDLSDALPGKPILLFKASSAPGAVQAAQRGKITDGCFLYRSPKSNRLFMTWSTFIPGKEYCVVLARSESGGIGGPWTQQGLLYTQDGGHAMLFNSFDGRLLMALHQPNSNGRERLHLFEISDDGDTLRVKTERKLR